MTVSNGNQAIPRTLSNSVPAHALSDAIAANDGLMANARITYAPLAVWKEFHWTCTVTNFASLARDRSE
jgi:hypothetical protein